MGRPDKQGLYYFPLDIDIEADDKVHLIQAKHGLLGFAILIKLYLKIYREGYFTRFAEKDAVIFAAKNNIDVNVCINVVNDCINGDLFDINLFNVYSVLTSKGIQERYFKITDRRKRVNFTPELMLIGVSDNNNLVNVNINSINVNRSTQSKVKESKVKNICSSYDERFNFFWETYPLKKKKETAYKIWQALSKKKELPPLDELLAILENHKKQKKWQDREFIPYPDTWLNQKRWEDEIETTKKYDED